MLVSWANISVASITFVSRLKLHNFTIEKKQKRAEKNVHKFV